MLESRSYTHMLSSLTSVNGQINLGKIGSTSNSTSMILCVPGVNEQGSHMADVAAVVVQGTISDNCVVGRKFSPVTVID